SEWPPAPPTSEWPPAPSASEWPPAPSASEWPPAPSASGYAVQSAQSAVVRSVLAVKGWAHARRVDSDHGCEERALRRVLNASERTVQSLGIQSDGRSIALLKRHASLRGCLCAMRARDLIRPRKLDIKRWYWPPALDQRQRLFDPTLSLRKRQLRRARGVTCQRQLELLASALNGVKSIARQAVLGQGNITTQEQRKHQQRGAQGKAGRPAQACLCCRT
ncbi:hypothetical protein HC891_17785, partial [Candidatus Gracilibacteria bacterium]|nr:hypothetical protein [Candidatus Gracilibacteria bacterium]